MTSTPIITLGREVRFGLHEHPPREASGNSFAGNPGLAGLDPFLTLTAVLRGALDPATGMLVNIKEVDKVLRQAAVPLLRTAYFGLGPMKACERRGTACLLPVLHRTLQHRFAPHALVRLELALSPYLKFRLESSEPTMVQLSQRFEFSAAHRLHSPAMSEAENVATYGKCTNPNGHGHNYELEVVIAGEPSEATGQVMPVEQLQAIVNAEIIERFDHKHLNLDCVEFAARIPTVEQIAQVIFDRLRPAIAAPAKLHAIRVWETPKTWAECTG